MDRITLQKVDESNFIACFNLELNDGQEQFVSHPIRSLAQAYVYYQQCTPFAVFSGGEVVGYVMVIYDYDEETGGIRERASGGPRWNWCWSISVQSPSVLPTAS